MGQFGVMIGQLVGFLIMLMVGYGCVRLRFYGQTALDGMCSLLLNVLIPVFVFSNAVDGADRAQLAANWGVMLLTAVMYALLILVFWLVAKLLRLKGSRSHVFQASLIFGNAGFIGIPLIMALWPQNGAIYVALMSIIDQTLLWTYGVWLCEPVAETTGARSAAGGGRWLVGGAGRRNDWRQRDWRARCGRERFSERRRFGGQCRKRWFSGRRPPLARHPRPRPA